MIIPNTGVWRKGEREGEEGERKAGREKEREDGERSRERENRTVTDRIIATSTQLTRNIQKSLLLHNNIHQIQQQTVYNTTILTFLSTVEK